MKRLIIGIAGGTGSGKTTVTRRIVNSLPTGLVLAVAHDSYYKDISHFAGLSPEEINFDHPSSLETSLLIDHLQSLSKGIPVDQPIYDFSNHRRKKETQRLVPASIVIVDGILLLVDKALRDLMDIKIFIDADADERLLRRMKRDLIERGRSIDSVMKKYVQTVKPMHLEFVEPSKRWADIIVPHGADNLVAIDMVVTKIKSMIGAALTTG